MTTDLSVPNSKRQPPRRIHYKIYHDNTGHDRMLDLVRPPPNLSPWLLRRHLPSGESVARVTSFRPNLLYTICSALPST